MARGAGFREVWGALMAAPGVAVRHVRRRWWSQSPHLPTFSARQLAWRRLTAYGSDSHVIERRDLIAYLAWVGRFRKATR